MEASFQITLMIAIAVIAGIGAQVIAEYIIVGKLHNTPVLPEKWIEAHHVEIWNQYKNTNVQDKAEIKQKAEVDRKAIA